MLCKPHTTVTGKCRLKVRGVSQTHISDISDGQMTQPAIACSALGRRDPARTTRPYPQETDSPGGKKFESCAGHSEMTTRSEDEAPTERYDTRRGVTVWARRQERPRSEACDVRVCRSHCHRVCPQRARSETLRTAAPARSQTRRTVPWKRQSPAPNGSD